MRTGNGGKNKPCWTPLHPHAGSYPICWMRLPKKIVAGDHKIAVGGGLCTSSS
ncbi:unnamed protein product [Prunus armeniaca]|uniref:Uncharacterized protein n=1 Tax=Prunus armeniaca TaxID=36596 RepID=A0A6J5VEJ0_PRUAR|nr:unnamed protein product [Prunus armeniaca]